MARVIPPDRLENLIECATRVFIERGYTRTQMADIAEALGVAKGTVYLYVESKEALFDLVARAAAGDRSFLSHVTLPVRTPKSGSTLRYAREQLARRQELPILAAALAGRQADDAESELVAILRELYKTLRDNRIAIKLLDRASADYPELARLWFEGGRKVLHGRLTEYLSDRIRRKAFRAVPNVEVAARLVLESVVFWAVHRHWDPHPETADEQVVEDSVIEFIKQSLVRK